MRSPRGSAAVSTAAVSTAAVSVTASSAPSAFIASLISLVLVSLIAVPAPFSFVLSVPSRGQVEGVVRVRDLRLQVAQVGLGHVHTGRQLLNDVDTQGVELERLVRVVAQQADAVGAERVQHLRGGRVVALVVAVAQGTVRGVGVEALVLKRVRVQLRVQADAPTLLTQVKQVTAGLGDPLGGLTQLRTAVAALGAEHVAGQ